MKLYALILFFAPISVIACPNLSGTWVTKEAGSGGFSIQQTDCAQLEFSVSATSSETWRIDGQERLTFQWADFNISFYDSYTWEDNVLQDKSRRIRTSDGTEITLCTETFALENAKTLVDRMVCFNPRTSQTTRNTIETYFKE